MTTKPKARKFRIRRTSGAPLPFEDPSGTEDGFGEAPFPGSAAAEARGAGEGAARPRSGPVSRGISEIREEGLTGRQLRMARRLAHRHGLQPASDFDAVRLLRAKGIDPFDRSAMLEVVASRDAAARPVSRPPNQAQPQPQARRQSQPQPQPQPQQPQPQTQRRTSQPRHMLPQRVESRPSQLPGPVADSDPLGLHELERIRRDIVARRRRKLVFLAARLGVFILLPTVLAFVYFAHVATPTYATKSEFIVQQADTPAQTGGLLGGTSLATSQDSVMVQDFLTSREAMLRLDKDHDYRGHFSDPAIDPLQRIEPGSSNEALYDHYRGNVKIGYDPTEGVIRMEVSATTPDMSRIFSEALISYAEERVDRVTERKRADQMRGARESFDEAEAKMIAAQERVLALQEQLGVIDPVSETTALMGQINQFEIQLAEKRLQLQQLLDNARPNQARVAGTEGDIARLQDLIAELRGQLTEQNATQGSLASMSAQLRMAEVDLETRTMMMQEALQQMEAARIEANRQVRFLSLGVAPIPPDEPTSPRVFENTLIAFLIFGAIYLLCSITAAVLREQVSN